MYSDQAVLPPQLPGSPSRFTLPPIGSPAPFSTSFPRLPYSSSPREQPGISDKTERWQLPPLVGLAPRSSTSSSYHHQYRHHPPALASSSTHVGPTQPFTPSSTSRTEEAPSIWRSEPSLPRPAPAPTTTASKTTTPLPPTSPHAVSEDPYYYTPYTDERPAIYSERIQDIDQEFSENREIIYLEKLKRLQEELSGIQHGGHGVFEDHIAELEKGRTEEIENAQSLMEYRIQYADKLFTNELRIVEEEAEAERRDLKKAMMFIIEEKRKRIKKSRDEDAILSNDFVLSTPQTRNHRRTRGATSGAGTEMTLEQLLMNKNGTKNHTSKRRYNDRSRDAANTNSALNTKNEAELDADFNAMRQQVMSTGTTRPAHDDEYFPDNTDVLAKRPRTSHYYSSPHSRSSRR